MGDRTPPELFRLAKIDGPSLRRPLRARETRIACLFGSNSLLRASRSSCHREFRLIRGGAEQWFRLRSVLGWDALNVVDHNEFDGHIATLHFQS
jgi:hypothetical protein